MSGGTYDAGAAPVEQRRHWGAAGSAQGSDGSSTGGTDNAGGAGSAVGIGSAGGSAGGAKGSARGEEGAAQEGILQQQGSSTPVIAITTVVLLLLGRIFFFYFVDLCFESIHGGFKIVKEVQLTRNCIQNVAQAYISRWNGVDRQQRRKQR